MVGFADDFEAIQSKMNHAQISRDDVTLDDLEGDMPSERVDGLDTEIRDALADEVDADGDLLQSKPDKPDQDAADKKVGLGVKDKSADAKPGADAKSADDAAIAEDLLKHVDGNTVIKVKGKEYKVADLPKEELASYVRKGVRFFQKMEELSTREKDLTDREAVISQNVDILRQMMSRQGGSVQSQQAAAPPDFLKPTEFDSEEVKTLKQFTATLVGKVDALERGHQESSLRSAEREMLGQIQTLKANDYPLASIEEVYAVKSMYPQIPLEKIMERSNQHYSSKTHVDDVFKFSPELQREFEESAIQKYLAKKKSAANIPQRKSGSTRVVDKKETPPQDFDQAEERARAYLRSMMAANKEGAE